MIVLPHVQELLSLPRKGRAAKLLAALLLELNCSPSSKEENSEQIKLIEFYFVVGEVEAIQENMA